MSKDIRYTVPFIGCGFNSWLLGKDATSPILTSWKSLLENVAWSEGLFPDDDLSAVIESMHSPTFVWEKLIFKVADRHKMKIADAENYTFKRISIQIQNETKRLVKGDSSICDRANQFIKAITHNYSKRVDIVSLNYDHLLINLLKEQGGTWKDAFKSPYNPGISINSQYYETDFLRMWFPHGCIPLEAWTEKKKTVL